MEIPISELEKRFNFQHVREEGICITWNYVASQAPCTPLRLRLASLKRTHGMSISGIPPCKLVQLVYSLQWCRYCSRHSLPRWLSPTDPHGQSLQLTMFAIECWQTSSDDTPGRIETVRLNSYIFDGVISWSPDLNRICNPNTS
ncbi:hypothetical protein GQ600_15810 [Phytophthora cactorum]|nr:hypothetical protein GQ600_15810 [Phytophthora cactorum]